MVFLMMWRHSMAGCAPGHDFDPKVFLNTHLETVLRGWASNAPGGKDRHENR
jgi:hypothetical protein